MAQVLLIALIVQQFMPMPAESTETLEDRTEQVERDIRAVFGKLQEGAIGPGAVLSELRRAGVPRAFLAIGALQAMAMCAGVAGLLLLAGLHAFGIRLRPRGNWAPGTPWLPLDAVEIVLFFGCCQMILGAILALILGGASGAATVVMSPLGLSAIYLAAALATIALLTRRTAGGLSRLWRAVRARVAPVALRLLQGAGGYAVALPLIVASRYLNPFGGDGPSSNPVISMLMGRQSTIAWIVFLVVIGLCAPVFEELVFRACLYPAFRRRWGVGVAIVTNGLLFGAIHGQLPEFVPLAVLGIVFAVLYEMTGSLLPCIVAHAAVNSITLVQLMVLGG
ncbi:MAG: type II CAAX endopeptidase family protein [Armatimonadota bacterium]|jgi:membrane protease YdiL (CAAX protease family)